MHKAFGDWAPRGPAGGAYMRSPRPPSFATDRDRLGERGGITPPPDHQFLEPPLNNETSAQLLGAGQHVVRKRLHIDSLKAGRPIG